MGKRCKPGTCTHDVPHGSHSTYCNHGCRCADCRAANAQYNAAARLQRWEHMQAGLVSPPHGSESTYINYMCRCDPCTAEQTRLDRDRKARRRGVTRVLVGLVLVAGSVAVAFADERGTVDATPVAWICAPDKPRCIGLRAMAGLAESGS